MNKCLVMAMVVCLGFGSSVFSQNKICTVRSTPDTFNFNRDKFNIENEADGVRLRFTASESRSYSLVLVSYPGQSIYKSLYFCGSDSLCSTQNTFVKSDSAAIQYQFSASPGNSYYFTVKPTTSNSFDKNFVANVGVLCTLTIAVNGNGTVSPPGPIIAPTYLPISLKALCASQLVYLSQWTPSNGLVSLSSVTDTAIFASLTGSASLTAAFLSRPINSIGFTKDTFNFTADGKRPKLGVLFTFTPTQTDTNTIEIADINSVYKQLVWCGTDPTFAATSISYSGYTFSYGFKATAGQPVYFRVIPNSQSNYADSFGIYIGHVYKLKITHTGNGTTSPADSAWLKPGNQLYINATKANYLSYFTKWTVTSGKPWFSDTLSTYTYVRCDSGNAIINMDFKSKQIYPIDFYPDTFTYNAYGTTVEKLLVFTAPSADTFGIVINRIGTGYSKTLQFYGSDSVFTTPQRYVYSYSSDSESTMGFRATAANQRFYFQIAPFSAADSTSPFSIRASRFATLYVLANPSGAGTTLPIDSIRILNGTGTQVGTSFSSFRYYFQKWYSPSGLVRIADSSDTSTHATIGYNSDSTISHYSDTVKALYQMRTIFPIHTVSDTFSFARHGGRASGGVLLSFTAAKSDTFVILFGDSGYSFPKNFYYYGNDNTIPNTALFDTTGLYGNFSYTVIANAGQTFYFRVAPPYSYYETHAFWARSDSALILTLTNDGNGTTNPATWVAVEHGSSTPISATPANSFYYFDRWVVVSGKVKITDSLSQTTTVRLDTGSAVIRAQFKQRGVLPITFIPDTFEFKRDGGGSGDSGILFRFRAPQADSFSIIVNNALSSAVLKYFYFYGTDSTFSTVVSGQSTYGYYKITGIVTAASAGQYLYFKVMPNSSYRSDSIVVYAEPFATLRILTDGRGTTTPQDSLRAPRGVNRTITAAAKSSLYYFKNWSRQTNGISFPANDSVSISTTVTIDSSRATIMANFGEKSPFDITFQPVIYNYDDGANTNSDGPLFVFTAPSAGKFAVGFDTAGPSSYSSLYYYGTDPLFSAIDTSITHYGKTVTSLIINAAAAGEKHYFRVAPYTTGYLSYPFAIRVFHLVKLTLQHGFGGTTVPSDSARVPERHAFSIRAVPNAVLSSFWKWSVMIGNEVNVDNVTFADTMATSTMVTINNGDATIKANFISKDVYPIASNPVVFRYDVQGGSSSDKSVAFKLNTFGPDSFVIVVKKKGNSGETFYVHGTRGQFDTVYSSRSMNNYTYDTSFGFRATGSNQTYYFRVAPYSSVVSDSFSIRAIGFYTLTTRSDCALKLTPDKPLMTVMNSPIQIYAAVTDSLYAFRQWTVASGTASIANDTLAATSVTLTTSSAVLNALCSVRPHDTLRVIDDGNGIAVPLQTVLVMKGRETTITAYPNSGYIFSTWQVVAGTAAIANPAVGKTTIKLPGGTVTVKAVFIPDPGAKPTVRITNVDKSQYPDICITALPRSETGRTITGLDSSAFTLAQDGQSVGFQLRSFSQVKNMSVALVIDRSTTMGLENRLVNAKSAARNFVSHLSTGDRAAIVSFSDIANVNQTMTSDTALLGKAIDNVIADGQTAIIDGASSAIDQLSTESNTPIMIIFSDGEENASHQSLSQVIAAAKSKQVCVYSIAVGADAFTGADAVLRPLADSTRGNFFYARSAADLTQLYQQIKADIASQYVMCYYSPDTVLNGQVHRIALTATSGGKTASDTASWNEGEVSPPVVSLSTATKILLSQMVASQSPITISATVKSPRVVKIVRLYYRNTMANNAANPYTEAVMSLSGTTYSAAIPTNRVIKPGVEFYIVAVDEAGNRGTSPNALYPETNPWVIPVDNTGPVISHLPVTASMPAMSVTIGARVNDPDGIKTVLVTYRKRSETFDRIDTMKASVADSFNTVIPAELVTEDGLQYYIKAFDTYGTASRVPDTTWYFIRVNKCPVISLRDTVIKKKSYYSLLVSAYDPDGAAPTLSVDSATMPKSAQFSSLGNGTGRFTWQTSCSDSARTYGIVFIASDGSCNKNALLNITISDSAFAPVFTSADRCTTKENAPLNFNIVSADCDNVSMKLVADSLPQGATFTSTVNGTGTLSWTPNCRSNGAYQVVFTASNAKAASHQNLQIIVLDSNCCLPDLKVSTLDTVVGSGSELKIRVTAYDCDSTVSRIIAHGLPDSSIFLDNGNSTASFTWTPRDTGLCVITFIAIDGATNRDSVKIQTRIRIGQLPVQALLYDRNGEGHLDRISLVWPSGSTLRPLLPRINELLDTVMITTLSGVKVYLRPINLVQDGDSIHVILDENRTGEFETGWKSALVRLTSIYMTDRNLPSRVTSYVDSAGPIIRSAFFFPGHTGIPAQLVVHFSEPVQWKQSDGLPGDFLNYFTTSEKPDPAAFSGLQAQHVLRATDSVVILLPNKFAVQPLRDSVSLRPYDAADKAHIYDAGTPGRTPSLNNRKQPVQLFSNIPVIACLYDTNGEGHLDRLVMTWPEWAPLKDMRIEPGDLIRSVKITTFNGAERTLHPSALTRLNSSSMAALLTENGGDTLETGWLAATIELTNARVTSIDTFSTVVDVVDSAGPVIQSAVWFPPSASNAGKGGLRIILSEPISIQSGATEDMINYFIDGSAAPSAAPFQSTAAAGRVHSGALLTVPIAAGFIVNPFHDSLNLHACGAAKLLTDSAGDNCPHPMNRKVPIGYEGTVPATAVLFDSNGEGHLDKITVRWAVPFELDSFPPMPKNAFDSMSITTFDGNRSDLWASDKKTADARSFSYNLIETQGALLQTGWKDATIRINSQIKFQERFSLDVDSIIDSAGPVIQSAELRLYGVSGKKGPDTLIVTFDEPVRIPAGQPFLPSDLLLFFREGSSIPEKAAFAGIDSMKYRFIGNDSCIQASVVLSNNLIVAPDHDSVSLRRHENALYCATDVSAANNPPHPANRRVAIKRCQACAHAQVDLVQNAFACENPFIPGESRIPPSLWPSIAGSVPSTGTRIEVDLKNGVVADGGVNGSVEIFDVVGNLIVGSKAMHGYAKNLYFYWDGKNDHGMTVSQGLYLAIVKVAASGTSGESISKIKIGVKYRKGN